MKTRKGIERTLLTATLLLAAAGAAHAQFGSFFRKMDTPRADGLTVAARQEPATVVVGQPCGIVLEITCEKACAVEDIRVGGLPELDGAAEYGAAFENLPDGEADREGYTVRRLRLPVRYLRPATNEVALTVQGMMVMRRQSGGMSFSSSSNFGRRAAPFRLDVCALPEKGRPAGFTGAVGTQFALSQRLQPTRVHPGDLVTATYELTYDGWFPTNEVPAVEGLGPAFKAYDLKETARGTGRVTWTQVLVPRTAAATNTAALRVEYYNPRTKAYETARVAAGRLTFVSEEAASTENTAVTVTDAAGGAAAAAGDGLGARRPLALRFAPSAGSPVIATVPPGTPVEELAREKGWRRVRTPRAVGWVLIQEEETKRR